MEIIYQARDIIEAQLVAGLLESKGIEANVNGTYLQGGIGELAPMGFATVSVEDDKIKAARLVIDDYEASNRQEQDTSNNTSASSRLNLLTLAVVLCLIVFMMLVFS